MKTYLAASCLLAASIIPLVPAEEHPEAIPLFDDVTLGDFYFDFLEDDTEAEDIFELKPDSGLLINGKGKSPAYIQTLDEYENYELTFEWRWPDEPGNSGIQLHSTTTPAYLIWPECIEVQMEHKNVGDFWLLNQTIDVEESRIPDKAAERNRRLKIKDEEKKPGEWNDMRIIAKRDTIEVYLNDKLVNEGENASSTSGYITIQAEDSNLEFRHVYLRELTEEELKEEKESADR